MLFVALLSVRAGTSKERIGRRMEWKHPEGARLVAEYWLQTPDPAVISIMEADHIGPIMAATSEWDDVFNVSVFPAITAEDGLNLVKKMMQR